MRKLILFATCFLIFATIAPADAQQIDFAFGVGTTTAPSASNVSSGNFTPQSIGGGAYPVVSADYLIKHNFGVQGEVSWRASQNMYFGYQPFRPILYDFNAIYAPPLGKHAAAELMAGIGAENVRFYQSYYNYSPFSGYTNYTSSNHFLGHVGGGLRLYVKGGFFVRPEAHAYFVRNNLEFSGSRITRYGVSIGYSFRPSIP